jgi:hypothetical protein
MGEARIGSDPPGAAASRFTAHRWKRLRGPDLPREVPSGDVAAGLMHQSDGWNKMRK